jgi:DNA-binding IscR family transcriptional regulator
MRTMITVTNMSYNDIEMKIASGERVTVKNLAEIAGVSAPIVRRLLQEKYGDKITFKRGRNGGIALSSNV